jgi:hypothetical protein
VWWGPLPTILGHPDQAVVGDGLGPRDQIVEIKTLIFSLLISMDQNYTQNLKLNLILIPR